MDGIAIVKDESRRNRHGKRRQVTNCPAEKSAKKKNPKDGQQAHKHYRQSQCPKIAAEYHEGAEKSVEMERSMVVAWIIRVVAVLGHLIAEPAVNSLVKVGRLDVQKGEPDYSRQQQDQCRN